MKNSVSIDFSVNGKGVQLEVAPDRSLLDILRQDLQLTGTKCGCNIGSCGSCIVIMNGKPVRSCVIKPTKLQSATIETIEGLSSNGNLHPLQTAFIERQGCQCGFCTPGMIMASKALLDEKQKPSESEIKQALRFNLCRCTGYEQAVEAVQQAADILKSGESTGRLELVGDEAKHHCVGHSVPRVDAKELVTGQAKYTDDIPNPEGTLFLATKRSDFAHAEILSIDSTRAEKIDGVVRIITAKDIPGENRYGKIIRDIPVLAEDKVRSYSDAVALVVAESYEIAKAGCDAINIEYKELPANFDPEKALCDDTPQIHSKGNLLYEFDIIKGDIDKGFEQCDVIVEEEFTTPRVDHGQIEPESALAYFDDDGKLCIKAPTQHVYFDRLNIIRALGIPKEDVHVMQPPVGGAFGKREDVYGQIHCALAAFLTRRPVRTLYSREETLAFTQKRHPARLRVKVGANKEGKLLAFKADALADTGAYASWGQNILRKICVHISGPYEIPNIRVHGKSVYTNNIFCGAMRGFGTPQAVFASESALDMLAEKLQMDRVEIRKINSFVPGSTTATGQVVTKTPGRETIELAAKKIGWSTKKEKNSTGNLRKGRGIASLWYGIGFGAGIPDRGNAIVELTKDGKAVVSVSTVDYGQGSNTVFSQIAAETLGLQLSDIHMHTGDSDRDPNCGSTVATRQTFVTGNAINNACKRLALDVQTVAAMELGSDIDNVMLANGSAFLKSDKKKMISLKGIIADLERYGKPRRREGFFRCEQYTQPLDPKTGQGNAYHPIAYGAQIAEVTVDVTTGKVKVDRIVACHYVGKALNPESVRGQVLGGISMGWGYALSEDSRDDMGKCTADTFGKYRMMKATDIPQYDVILLEDPETTGPYGAIGVGEPPTVATAPAIINAIYDAVGVRITDLPATPEKILSALKG